MKMPLATVATLVLAAATAFAPANAATTSGPATVTQGVTFNTALAPLYYGAGEYDGVLHLRIAGDGAISGWYRDADVGSIHTVVGGLTGTKLWLDLGVGNLIDLVGTLESGKIEASTYLGDQNYTFTGTLTKN